MIVIGLTGSIASGKTTVAEIFKNFDCVVFDADNKAKSLYNNPLIADKVSKLIGDDILSPEGNPKFELISNFIFSSKENNKRLTDILYPHLTEKFYYWKENNNKEKILILEAAMLFESGWDSLVDITVNVSADENTRFNRIRLRNNNNPQNYILRDSFQLSNENKNERADYIIVNDEKSALLPQIDNLLKIIKKNNKDKVIGTTIIKNNIPCDKLNFLPKKDFIYEVIRVVDSKPIFPKEHFDRLLASNKFNNLNFDFQQFIQNILQLCELNKIENCNVKIIYDYYDSYFLFIKSNYPTIEDYKAGANLCSAVLERDNPNLKKVNINFRLKAELLIAKNNVFEVLLINNDGKITEGSRSNVFFVKDNEIITAPDDLVLKGVTRAKVIDVIQKLGIKINFAPLDSCNIGSCDGAFLTGTSIAVYNIRRIDGVIFKDADELIEKIFNEYFINIS
ncbi:dephospho-CoA kinase [Bacteroidales bacterium OttesenSCG-928-L14]|nr:dephospho-CoA kinase [Bacteroidales bacterium OttesenSCG-928-L14]